MKNYQVKTPPHVVGLAGVTGLAGQTGLSDTVEKLYAANQPVEREREIPERIRALHQVVEFLSERVAVLRDRTAVVSGPTPPMNKNEVIPSRTELGGALAELASRIALIGDGVNDILLALEL